MSTPYALYVDHTAWADDWRGFISWVGRFSTARQDEYYTPEQAEKHVINMFLRGHLSVFEHWPITLTIPNGARQTLIAWLLEKESPTVFTIDPLSDQWQTNLAALIALENAPLDLPGGYLAADRTTPGRPRLDLEHGHNGPPNRHTLATFNVCCGRACADQQRTYRVLNSYVMESQRSCMPQSYVPTGDVEVDLLVGQTLRATQAMYAERSSRKAREKIRAAYPMNATTRYVHTATLSRWVHYLDQRLAGTTGKPADEIREIAFQIDANLRNRYGSQWRSYL